LIVLYHCESARSFRPLWMLEELQLPYELRMLPFPPRVLQRDYLDINPLGTVPAFFDGETKMTESAAICQYLAGRYGAGQLDIPPDSPNYGAYLNWLHFGEATLTFPQTLVLRYGRFEPAERRLPQAVEDYSRWFHARLRGLEAVVSSQPFVCGDSFTAADISVGYALMLAEITGLAADVPEQVANYWAQLQQRPAYQNALEQQEAARTQHGIASWID
jgi:glutathione S-transferase